MMNCANCGSEIEKDSFFCDQCGREVLLCVTCGAPGKGSFCENDGGDLKAARLLAGGAPPPVKEEKAAPPPVKEEKAEPRIPAPVLRLVNNKLGIRLEIVPGAILGRT